MKTFKMKWLISPLNIHPLKITLRENPKALFLHIIEALKKTEEELTPITKSDREKLHSEFDRHQSETKAINEHIADMLEKLHDKSNKKIEKQ